MADEPHGPAQIFDHVIWMVIFFVSLWVVGKMSVRIGLPALVGEIITGIIMGPNLLDVVPYPDALKVIGDIGLLLLVLEAGIDVNMGILKVVGTRGLMLATFGSMTPLGIGAFIAYMINDNMQPREAVAIGACFAPTSMGIALNVLRNGGVYNTPTGQLIIAAAVLDDVIALMLLSVLSEFAASQPSVVDITISIAASPVYILLFGFIAIKLSPAGVRFIMDKINIKYHEYAILIMLFGSMLVLVPACFYSKSSFLLGAFLAGLMFCTDHTIHHVWEKQMKRIMHWILRIFFACTIGFEVPIKDFFTNKKVLYDALIYTIAIIGKVATGIFATTRPIQITEFFIIACAMSAWGEFAFILATSAYAAGIFDKDTMTSILMAVLFSVILAPWGLRITLRISHKKKQAFVMDTRKQSNLSRKVSIISASESYHHLSAAATPTPSQESGVLYKHNVYYCIHTKTYGKWGHQNRLLKSLYSLHLEIIDFRAFNEPEDNYSHIYVQDIFYVKDTRLSLLPTKQLDLSSKQRLGTRVKAIRGEIKVALQDKNATITIMRWLPGIKQRDDMTPASDTVDAKLPKLSISYVRNEAYKQARMALSYQILPRRRLDYRESESKTEQRKMHDSHSQLSHHSQSHSFPAITYITRIKDVDAQQSKKATYAGDVLDEEKDGLVKLKFADDPEASIGDGDDPNTMSLEDINIIYGDETHSPNMGNESNNQIRIVKFNPPTSPDAKPNQSTPLLKESQE